jgi:hypothetical protein
MRRRHALVSSAIPRIKRVRRRTPWPARCIAPRRCVLLAHESAICTGARVPLFWTHLRSAFGIHVSLQQAVVHAGLLRCRAASPCEHACRTRFHAGTARQACQLCAELAHAHHFCSNFRQTRAPASSATSAQTLLPPRRLVTALQLFGCVRAAAPLLTLRLALPTPLRHAAPAAAPRGRPSRRRLRTQSCAHRGGGARGAARATPPAPHQRAPSARLATPRWPLRRSERLIAPAPVDAAAPEPPAAVRAAESRRALQP